MKKAIRVLFKSGLKSWKEPHIFDSTKCELTHVHGEPMRTCTNSEPICVFLWCQEESTHSKQIRVGRIRGLRMSLRQSVCVLFLRYDICARKNQARGLRTNSIFLLHHRIRCCLLSGIRRSIT